MGRKFHRCSLPRQAAGGFGYWSRSQLFVGPSESCWAASSLEDGHRLGIQYISTPGINDIHANIEFEDVWSILIQTIFVTYNMFCIFCFINTERDSRFASETPPCQITQMTFESKNCDFPMNGNGLPCGPTEK